MSSTFAADVNDTLSLKWYAAQTSDYYDVFGFVFADADDDGNWDSGESYQKLFHGIGSQTDGWETINTSLTIGSDDTAYIFS